MLVYVWSVFGKLEGVACCVTAGKGDFVSQLHLPLAEGQPAAVFSEVF